VAAEVDVIVSAFATPPQEGMRALAQDKSLFHDQPFVLDVPYQQYMRPEHRGIAASAFGEAARRLRQPNGSILEGLLAKYAKGYHPRSVTLVSFSAGTTFLEAVIDGPDADWVDGIVVLDGIHLNRAWDGSIIPSELTPWVNFGRKAARDERLMVVACTNITPSSRQITPTSESSSAIFDALWEQSGSISGTTAVPLDWDLLTRGPPPPAVSVTGGNPRATKTFEQSPLGAVDQVGNAWFLNYGGTLGVDHIYVAWYGQRDIWRSFLAPRLNSGVLCKVPSLAGLGETECAPNRVLIPQDVYPASPMFGNMGAALGGLAAGVSVGYLFGKIVG
jgi:hypothetical protein